MPFKLIFKKTRQYNVASKNLFVISVELLDGGIADCTLSVDSTGQECLDNVCQRQAINQPEFFGLRYVNNDHNFRWVELNLPLKRQLDKHASSHQLHLRVMYYVTFGTSLITDEVTQNLYFLQLKSDLIEGRIVCDYQQAVVLAAYSRQAEYGNHDRERHTVEYLKNLLTFPKQIQDGGQVVDGSTLAPSALEWLTAAVIQHHMALHNMSQAQAENGFISVCQKLRYYGQEMFSTVEAVKGTPLTIAVSLTGITLLLTETEEVKHIYRWQDITNVINHKRTFTIECRNTSESMSFILPTPEEGKYVWRMCVLQHTFYMKHQNALTEKGPGDEPQPQFQEHGLSESREELDRVERSTSVLEPQPLTASHRAFSTSCLELEPQPHPPRVMLPSYRPAPDYETAIQQKYQQQRAEAQAARFQAHPHQLPNKPLGYGSHPDIHRIHYPDVTRHTVSVNQGMGATDDYKYGLKLLGHNNYTPSAVNPNVQTDFNVPLRYVNIYKPPPPYPSGLASNSTPDLAVASQALSYHRSYINPHVSGSSPDLVSTRTALNRQYLGYLNGTHMVNYNRNILPATHGTYNNLASVLDLPNPHIIMDPHHLSDNIQTVHDERGNTMYSIPVHRLPYQRHLVISQPPPPKLSSTNEPIYENIPLPWQNNKGTIRDRAQSLTTSDEITRLSGRNSSHPSISTINKYSDRNINLQVPNYLHVPPSIQITDANSHYVNAQVIKDVRESSVPKDLNVSTKCINRDHEFDNIALSVDRISLNRDDKSDYVDETPYQSLSTHRVSNMDKPENVTSINIPEIKFTKASIDNYSTNVSHSSGIDSSIMNSTVTNSIYSTSLDSEISANATKNVSSKEKKRRRWGVFIGRSNKNVEVKSATLGRDRNKNATSAATNKHRWSTGLPKFQPLPPSITKETLCQILERKMTASQLSFAFEKIPKGRESGGEMATALLPENAHINAYSSEYLPYEDNRVRLNPSPMNRCGYINASHITMTVGSSQRFYVIAKVPPPSSVPPVKLTHAPPALEHGALLWECVWQVGARVIALVNGDDHPEHLPSVNSTIKYGKFTVTCESRTVSEWGVTSSVKVTSTHMPARVLYHVQYSLWPPTTVLPEPASFLSYLSEVGALRRACSSTAGAVHSKNAPLVVCCHQGAGRSGTTLAADLLLHTLDYNQELDIPRTVSLLHQQRANLIQNVHQYKFLHEILLHYLKQSRLI